MRQRASTTKEKKPSALAGDKERNSGSNATGTSSPLGEQEPWEPWGNSLLEEMLASENMKRALKRVRENKGAEGIDEMQVDELEAYLKREWPRIRKELLESRYEPKAVRRVVIPKADGGERLLGIPTVIDRLIQQAIHQGISPLFEKGFSESSYGYRPGRRAQQAVECARQYVTKGRRWVVEIDLEKFFDRVNHDILMDRVERRGSSFCRYADDCNIYVYSQRAGERVKASVTKYLLEALKLKVNEKKSAVARPCKRKFLGYTVTMDKETRLRAAQQSIKRLKDKFKDVFRGGRGCNIGRLIKEKLNPVIRGWGTYFRLSEVKRIFEELDGWIRRKLRNILWRQMKRVRTRAKRMMERGLSEQRAWTSACNERGPWWNTGSSHMNEAYPLKYFREHKLVELQMSKL